MAPLASTKVSQHTMLSKHNSSIQCCPLLTFQSNDGLRNARVWLGPLILLQRKGGGGNSDRLAVFTRWKSVVVSGLLARGAVLRQIKRFEQIDVVFWFLSVYNVGCIITHHRTAYKQRAHRTSFISCFTPFRRDFSLTTHCTLSARTVTSYFLLHTHTTFGNWKIALGFVECCLCDLRQNPSGAHDV